VTLEHVGRGRPSLATDERKVGPRSPLVASLSREHQEALGLEQPQRQHQLVATQRCQQNRRHRVLTARDHRWWQGLMYDLEGSLDESRTRSIGMEEEQFLPNLAVAWGPVEADTWRGAC